MDNPELVEEYPREYELTQFEKIQVAATRAKDLHNANKTPLPFNSNSLRSERFKGETTWRHWPTGPAWMAENDSPLS